MTHDPTSAAARELRKQLDALATPDEPTDDPCILLAREVGYGLADNIRAETGTDYAGLNGDCREAVLSALRHLVPPAPPGDGGGERVTEEIGSILREINDWDGCRVLGLVPNGDGRWEVVDVIEPELYDVAGVGIVSFGGTPLEAVTKAREALQPSAPQPAGEQP